MSLQHQHCDNCDRPSLAAGSSLCVGAIKSRPSHPFICTSSSLTGNPVTNSGESELRQVGYRALTGKSVMKYRAVRFGFRGRLAWHNRTRPGKKVRIFLTFVMPFFGVLVMFLVVGDGFSHVGNLLLTNLVCLVQALLYAYKISSEPGVLRCNVAFCDHSCQIQPHF